MRNDAHSIGQRLSHKQQKKRNTPKSEDRVKVKHVNWFELKVDHKITKNIN